MNALVIEDLTKNYRGFRLDHLSLTLPEGCIMGLIGENGAGKSTTIKLILNMIQRDGGTISIYGKDNRRDMQLLKEDMGVVLDEVGYPECLTGEQIGRIMARTFSRWDDRYYDELLERLSVPKQKEFKDFSRGMKMKMGIITALAHHPKLLLLDEATSGLDPVVRDDVLDLFNEFTREEEHAILVSSHIVSDLEKICDYIAFLHHGKLLLCDEKDRLLERYGLIHCSREQLSALQPSAIIGKKTSPYGVEAVVDRRAVPAGMQVNAMSIEDLFVMMVKGER